MSTPDANSGAVVITPTTSDGANVRLTILPTWGTAAVNDDGSYTYTPDTSGQADNAEAIVTDRVQFTATASSGFATQSSVSFELTGVNRPPALRLLVSDSDAVPGAKFFIPVTTDADGDPVTVSVTGAPVRGTVVANSGGTFSYSPAAGSDGALADTMTFTANDSRGGLTTRTVAVPNSPVGRGVPVYAITYGNAAPTVTLTVATNEPSPGWSKITPVFSDPDGDSIELRPNAAPRVDLLFWNRDNTFDFLPNTDFVDVNDSQTFYFTVVDSHGASSTATFTRRGNGDTVITEATDAPTVNLTTVHDPYTGAIVIAPVNSSPDAGPITAVLATSPSSINGTVIANDDGTFTYARDPNSTQIGDTDTLTFVVTSNNETSTTASITFTVTELDNPPALAGLEIGQQQSGGLIPIRPIVYDPNGDPVNAVFSNPQLNTNGFAFTTLGAIYGPNGTGSSPAAWGFYRPDRDGTETIEFTAKDSLGIATRIPVTFVVTNDAILQWS
ncbi:MAG: Ig-like domain-containing protein [Mycolicibacterium sp.]